MTRIHLPLAFAFTLLNVSAQNAPTITIDGGNAVDLCACRNPNFRLSVTAKNVGSTKPSNPIVVEASIGNMRDNALADIFTPSWSFDGKNNPIALNLAIANPALLSKAGAYNVVIDALPDIAGSQKITLQINHPAATLQVPAKLIVRRRPEDSGAGEFSILEQSGRTDVTDLQAITLQPAVLGTDPVTGTVDLSFPNPVPAGQAARVVYRLKGEFPLGTVTGSAQLSSPQLSQAVTLNWEVRTARWIGWIAFYAFVGSLASWVLKTFLQTRIQLGEARVKADNLIARVEADLNNREDEKFRATVQQPLADLKVARNTNEPADIDTARNALDQAWRSALTTLAADRQTLVAGIDDLKTVLEIAGATPPSLAADVQQAKTGIAALDPLLVRDNIHAGALELTGIRGRLGTSLRMHGIEWQQRIGRLLDALVQQGPGISAAIKQSFTPVVQDVKQRLGSIKNETAASTAQDIGQLISVASTELSQARDALELLKSKVQTELEQALEDLNNRQIGSQQDRDNLKAAVEELANELPAAATAPDEMLNGLPATLTAIDDVWRKTFPNTLPNIQAVQARLDAQDYLGAVNAAIGRGVILRGAQEALAEDWTQSLHLIATPAPKAISRQTIFGIALPTPDEPVEVRTRTQLLWDKSLQSAILFVLVAIGALSMYHATFVGNIDDALKIFFWAFSIDITVDAVRTALKPKTGS